MKTVRKNNDAKNTSSKTKLIYQFVCHFGFCMFGAAVIVATVYFINLQNIGLKTESQQRIATVNLTKIVDDFVKQAAKQSTSQEEQQYKVQAFSKKLDTALHELAKKDNLILMPSEAVIAGAEDVTDKIKIL